MQIDRESHPSKRQKQQHDGLRTDELGHALSGRPTAAQAIAKAGAELKKSGQMGVMA
ncbi:MAG: hypothetical protein AAFR28_19860 [Pseudomonadota bacterium]